nr:uncharacterized protein LOC113823953 [Penaeus vannamei]
MTTACTRFLVFTATVHLTANHMGWFEFRLCPSEKPGQYVKQSCLNKHVLKLVDYSGTRYKIKHSKTGLFRIRLQLPESVTCSRCVVQWHYTTGNNWGFCKDGSNQPGCGPQEVFRGCSDVAVFAPDDPALHLFSNLTREADLSQFLHLSEDEAPPPAPPRTNAHRNDEPDAAFDPVLVFDGEEHFADDDDDALAGQGHRAPGANDLLKAAGPSGAAKQPSITFVEEAKGGGAVASARPRPPPSTPGHQAPRLLRRGAGRAAAAQEVRVVRRLPQEPAGDPHRGRALPLGAHALLPLVARAPSPRREGLRAVPADRPSEEYEIVTTFGDAAGPVADTHEAVQETLPLLEEITPTVLQLFQNYPSLARGGPASAPLAFQVPLTSVQDDSSMDRLLMLQQALSLTSTSGTQSDSPIVLILM